MSMNSNNQNTGWVFFGLGIGLIISALFFLFLPSDQLTDEEIVTRAKNLGMVKAAEVESPKEIIEDEGKGIDEPKVEVTIPAGANVNQIAQILLDNGIIDNKENFNSLVELARIETKFIAGTYDLPLNGDLGAVILTLTGIKK